MSPTTSTTVSPLLARHGAVEGEGPDAGVAWHYGDPVREQRLLAEGLAAVDLSHRGVVTISGPDRLTWLHSMTTQHLLGLSPRTSRESLVLSPKGHVEHALHLVDDGETTWITVEPGTASALVSWLESMRFMLRVEVADVSADWAVLGEPIGTESVPGEPLAWVDPWPGLVGDTVAYGPVEGHPAAGRTWRELIVGRAGLEAAVGDRPLAGTWAAEALRVAAWRPRLGFETDHRTIAHEVDWLRTRRAPAQGLLPRPGDHRPGAQPGPAAAAAGLPAPRRVRARAAAGRCAGAARRARGGPAQLGGTAPRGRPDGARRGQALGGD